MSGSLRQLASDTLARPHLRWLEGLGRRFLIQRLDALPRPVELVENGARTRLGRGDGRPLTLEVKSPALYSSLVRDGHLGGCESYIRGDWRTDDLVGFCRAFTENIEGADNLEGPWARLTAPLRRLRLRGMKNSRRGSRRNISAHYDLGNEFFAAWLDPSLTYSAGYYPRPDATLEQAQSEKLDRICRKLDLKRDQRLVEIGTGWGSFAMHAAQHYGARVTTTTISRRQHEIASARVAEAGLQDRVQVVLKDYRELEGQFDALVSIEMVEAVGHEFLPIYLQAIDRLLAPHGAAVVQGITVREDRYEIARKSEDFIKRFVFPGSCLLSVSRTLALAAKRTSLELVHDEAFGLDYARTLEEWRLRFHRAAREVEDLGYDQEFQRLWELYLAYCEAGFRERYIDVHQFTFAKPRCPAPGRPEAMPAGTA